MGRKLLFVLGIVVAHGALAAGLASQGAALPRTTTVANTCMPPASKPLHFSPPRELLAYSVSLDPHAGEMRHP